MKKNGFTLIEVLSVVVLLGVIALISIPMVRNMIKDSRQKLYDEQMNLIEDGLKNWANANIFLLPEDNSSITLSLGQLKQSGFAEMKISNPKNNKCFSNESTLKITNYNNSYIYEVDKITNVDCDLIDEVPIIKLNGSVVERLYIGDTYIDKGATAKASNGTDITSDIVTTITGGGNEIDMSSPGYYTITYSITDKEKTSIAIRNVIISYKYKNGVMSSADNCINSGICQNGTLVNVKVNVEEDYNFYVINDNEQKLTLIMDRNLGNRVAWITKDDYNDDENYGDYGNTSKGPITAFTYLNNQTSDWTNIDKISNYTYYNNLNGTTNKVGYRKLEIVDGITKLTSQDGATITNVEGVSRARLLTYEEAIGLKTINLEVTPTYLYTNLSGLNTVEAPYGYWYLTAHYSVSSHGYILNSNGNAAHSSYVFGSTSYGIRPVIEISK